MIFEYWEQAGEESVCVGGCILPSLENSHLNAF